MKPSSNFPNSFGLSDSNETSVINQVAINLFEASRTRARLRNAKEKAFEALLFIPALLSVFITLAIAFVLVTESLAFFAHVSIWEFLTGTQWTPLFEAAHYGILPLLCGTLLTATIALTVALPVGTFLALFLSEYVNPKFRGGFKTVLELLSAIPTVVFGYFALLVVTPILQKIIPGLGGFNVLGAGIVMGIMILPYVCSLSEDAMRAVPMELREGSYALGSSRWETAFKVVLPAANSGVIAAYTLAIARAVGETMIVAIAAGMQPNLTLNPTQPAETITAYIVQVSLGDLPHGSIGYQTIFAAGLMLFLITFFFNCAGSALRSHLAKRV